MASFSRASKQFCELLKRNYLQKFYAISLKQPTRSFYKPVTLSGFSANPLRNKIGFARTVTSQTALQPRQSLKRDEDQLTVTGQLEFLDHQVQRYGRVTANQVSNVLKQIARDGKISEQDSLMLIRCTGSVLKHEDGHGRMALFNKVWAKCKELGVISSISQYNAALRVQIENQHPVSPPEFLAELESQRVFPNRITYQLLIARYCEDGDVEGALKILEHLKAQRMAVNETVFNALIKGYCKQDNFEAADQVISSMSEAGLDPSADTFKVLACAHASRGNMAAVQEVLERAQKAEAGLQGRHLLDIILELSESGHQDYVPQVLEMLKEKQHYYIDGMNTVGMLLTRGHHQLAFDVFLSMQPADLSSGDSRARNLVRTMILANLPLEQIINYMHQLNEHGHASLDVGTVLYFALQHGRGTLALQAMEEMKKRDEEIKPHFFWRVFRQYKEDKNIEGLYDCMKAVIEALPKKECVGTLNKEGVTSLVDMGEPLDDICNKLKEFGLNSAFTEGIRLVQLVRLGQYEEALALMKLETVEYFPMILRSIFQEAFKTNPDLHQFTEAVAELQKRGVGDRHFLSSGAMMAMTNINLGKDTLEQLITEFHTRGLKLEKASENLFVGQLSKQGVSDESLQVLRSLMVSERQARTHPESAGDLIQKNLEELEEVKDSYEKKGVRSFLLNKLMLNKYCQAGKVAEAEALRDKLEGQGFVFTADSLRQLGYMESRYKENLEGSLKYKNLLETQYPEFFSYTGLIMNIAVLQVKAKNIQAAVEMLESYMQRHGSRLDKAMFADGFTLGGQCETLMEAASEACDNPDQVKELGMKLFDLGYIKRGSFSVLQAIMKSYVDRDDYDGALKTLEGDITMFGRAAKFSDLLNALIIREDAVRLQKAVDLLTSIFGELKVLHHLVICFVDCGKVKQARKILSTPGIRAVNTILKNATETFHMKDKVKELENLVLVTKNLFAVDRDEMLFSLIRMYAKTEELDKCLDVYATFEEEGVKPRGRTLRYLAKVLESKGRPVPFEVPQAAEDLAGSTRPAVSPLENEALEAAKQRDFNKVLELKKRIQEGGEMLSTGFLTTLAESLLQKRETYAFKRLAHELGTEGDVESLLHIRQSNLPRNMDNFVHQRLFYAYIHSGRIEELLDFLTENPVLLPKYSTTGAIDLLGEKRPELLPKYEAILNLYAQTVSVTRSEVFNHMFSYYILKDQLDQAERMLEQYPKFKEQANFSYVTRQARDAGKEELLIKLADWIRSTHNPKSQLSYLYSALITVKNEQGSWAESLSYYEQAIAEGLATETLWAKPLLRLEEMLEANSQPIPWTKGSIQSKATRQEISYDGGGSSSSSDSDSSSDDEKSRAPRKNIKH